MSHKQVVAHAIFHITKPQIAQPAIGVASRSNPNFHFRPPSQHPFTAPSPQPSRMLSSSVTHPSVSSFYRSHWPRSSFHLGRYIYFLPLRSAHHLGSLCLCLSPPSQMGIFLSSALITLLFLHAPSSRGLIAANLLCSKQRFKSTFLALAFLSFLILIFQHTKGHLHLSGLASPQTKQL